MGLGLHGGGIATARYCATSGARVTVTDLRPESELEPSLAELNGLPIRYVLGRHDENDFRNADIVIKNPAVPRTSRFLECARRIETDISIFLGRHKGPVYAITGTKGKSTTATALHHILRSSDPTVRLGGNITVSPLTFAHELAGVEPIVLELSSFQLGDLLMTPAGAAGTIPRFAVSAITNLMTDHQDYYHSMASYAADKQVIFSRQGPSDWVLLSKDDEFSRGFAAPVAERTLRVTAGAPTGPRTAGMIGKTGCVQLPGDPDPVELVPDKLSVVGQHQRINLLFAAAAARLIGRSPGEIRDRIASFGGVPHRLEHVGSIGDVDYFNDSAATIAEAALAGVHAFSRPVHLIAGGSDKGLPLDAFLAIADSCSSLHLLSGTATERIIHILEQAGRRYSGPHATLGSALKDARSVARANEVILLSPGCASFGMFRNEFDRGNQFRELVRMLLGAKQL